MRSALTRLERIIVRIEAAIARCRSRKVPMCWFVGPATRPSDLGDHLLAHGFTHAAVSAGMAADLLTLNESLPAPPDLTIEPVKDLETLKQWYPVWADGFGMPDFTKSAWLDYFAGVGLGAPSPLRHYLGRLDGKPVATVVLLLGAGVAGIYFVATLPEARRQGIGTAMTLAPMRDARALGYRVGVLGSTKMAFNVYRQLGFREYCKINLYLWMGEKEQHGEASEAG